MLFLGWIGDTVSSKSENRTWCKGIKDLEDAEELHGDVVLCFFADAAESCDLNWEEASG